jgi:hypothetical protein
MSLEIYIDASSGYTANETRGDSRWMKRRV